MRAGPGGGGGGAGLPGVAGRWLSPCPPPGRYREASAEVMQVLSRFAAIERASIDEAYLDLTGSARHRLRQLRGRPLPAELLPSTFVQGLPAEPGGNGPRPADPGGKGTHPLPNPALSPPNGEPGNGVCVFRINGVEGAASPPCGWNALTEGCGCWLGLADTAGPFAGLSKRCRFLSLVTLSVSLFQRSCGSVVWRSGWRRCPSITRIVLTCS